MRIFMFVIWIIVTFISLIALILGLVDGNVEVIRRSFGTLTIGIATVAGLNDTDNWKLI